jgi:DNA-binding transcriptional ArsR family regulator
MSEQTQNSSQPDPVFVISDLATLRILTDSFRLQIVGALSQPSTVKTLADRLQVQQVKLYYHINLLEQHGLIRVVGSRVVSGILEKIYQASAFRYQPAPELLALPPASGEAESNFDAYISTMLDTTKADLKRSHTAGRINMANDAPRIERLVSVKALTSLTPEKADKLYLRLKELLAEMEELDSEGDPTAEPYEMLLVLFPTLIEDE